MSRYSIPAQQPGLTVIVGWDNPLRRSSRRCSIRRSRRTRKRASCGSAPHQRPSPRSRRSRPSSPAGPRSHPTSWTASPAISKPPRRRPRSSGGHTSSCTTLGRPAPTVPNAQPHGSLVLPTGQGHQPSDHGGLADAYHTDRRHPTRSSPTASWRCWSRARYLGTSPGTARLGLPRNLFSQRSYSGINVWLLTAMGYASPFWATFHQVKAAGGSVRKGARGVPVVFWKVYNHEDTETGEAEKRFVLRQYTVFNAAQLDGVAIPEITVLAHRFTPIERCAQLVDAMPHRPAIIQGHQRAFYTPATDTLHLPSPACFQSPEAYYATSVHELVHATGHPSRLNRTTLTDLCLFGDPTYAKEELVAEMGAAYLCGVCGIANATLDNSAAYLQSWMAGPAPRPDMLVHAAAQAQTRRRLHPKPPPRHGRRGGARSWQPRTALGTTPSGSNAPASQRAEGYKQERAARPRTRTAARSSTTLHKGEMMMATLPHTSAPREPLTTLSPRLRRPAHPRIAAPGERPHGRRRTGRTPSPRWASRCARNSASRSCPTACTRPSRWCWPTP